MPVRLIRGHSFSHPRNPRNPWSNSSPSAVPEISAAAPPFASIRAHSRPIFFPFFSAPSTSFWPRRRVVYMRIKSRFRSLIIESRQLLRAPTPTVRERSPCAPASCRATARPPNGGIMSPKMRFATYIQECFHQGGQEINVAALAALAPLGTFPTVAHRERHEHVVERLERVEGLGPHHTCPLGPLLLRPWRPWHPWRFIPLPSTSSLRSPALFSAPSPLAKQPPSRPRWWIRGHQPVPR